MDINNLKNTFLLVLTIFVCTTFELLTELCGLVEHWVQW